MPGTPPSWPRARELGPLLIIWLVSLGIIVLQRDLGTGLLIFGMFVAMPARIR